MPRGLGFHQPRPPLYEMLWPLGKTWVTLGSSAVVVSKRPEDFWCLLPISLPKPCLLHSSPSPHQATRDALLPPLPPIDLGLETISTRIFQGGMDGGRWMTHDAHANPNKPPCKRRWDLIA